MAIGQGKFSLTKHYLVEELVTELAEVTPGMTNNEVRQILTSGGHAHAELADDLLQYEDGQVVDDVMLEACREVRPEAPLLVWVALLMADARLASVVENILTTADGKLNPEEFNTERLRQRLPEVIETPAQKAGSNILRYFETAGLTEPEKRGGTIIGLGQPRATSFAVPAITEYVAGRLTAMGVRPPDGADPVDLALGVGANQWLNLTPEEYRRAAVPVVAATPIVRAPLPPELVEVDAELRRKRQVVLQGPPGVGKTWLARRYIEWLCATDPAMARITDIIESLPLHERTPERVADRVEERGLPAVWDLVQFHPSYTYEDFVRSLQAQPVAGGVTFVATDKLLGFVAALGAELERRGSEAELAIVIDEINRGDVSKILGELIYALEYRDEPVTTPYAVRGTATLRLPQKLVLVGTMNTADRSIALIDYALRRRFVFLDVLPDRGVVAASQMFAGQRDRDAALHLYDTVAGVFTDEAELRDIQPGHSYFLPERQQTSEEESAQLLARRFAYEIWPLLIEYEAEGRFDPDRLDLLLVALGQGTDFRPGQSALANGVASYLLSRAGE